MSFRSPDAPSETVGHGAGHHVHPVDGNLYLDIGEGQDGSVILRGGAGVDGEAEFVTYPWWDRCLIDLAPDGQQFMTVDHGQADVAFHRTPAGTCSSLCPSRPSASTRRRPSWNGAVAT